MSFYQVASHWSWWNNLTYEYNTQIQPGVRVRIPLGKGTRIGFILNKTEESNLPDDIEIRGIESILDQKPVLPQDLWDLALWMSRTFLCSVGTALWSICPEKFLSGEPVTCDSCDTNANNSALTPASADAGGKIITAEDRANALAALAAFAAQLEKSNPDSANNTSNSTGVNEQNCFDPRDDVRWAFYRDLIFSCCKSHENKKTRTLVLFPDEIAAQKFFDYIKSQAQAQTKIILWPSTTVRKKGATRWDVWLAALNGDAQIIIGPPSAVFAPIHADRIIVDDEASPGYVLQFPTCHVRSLAGRRAISLDAEIVLGGRMPSGKTFTRLKHSVHFGQGFNPNFDLKDALVLVDLKRSIKATERGIEGELPVTISLLDRTCEALANGRSVMWMLDRKGGALEVFCSQCGHSLTCPQCGGVMRSVKDGQKLKCYRCGRTQILPERCPECKGQFWTGKRPGIESLKESAARLLSSFPKEKILLCEGRPSSGMIKTLTVQDHENNANLILGTRGALPLCDVADIDLIGWIDIDSELRSLDYDAKFNAFNMIWTSLWRGPRSPQVSDQAQGHDRVRPMRTVLLQCRRCDAIGRELSLTSKNGWMDFWHRELTSRSELDLPPTSLMVEINLTRNDDRLEFIQLLENAGLFVMDPGEPDQPLWIPTRAISPVAQALAPRFNLTNVRKGYPTVTVHSE